MGNITNDTFNPIRAYCNARLQQGVPLVDADVNELDDIRKFELRAFLKWFVGNGVRVGGDGFHILPTSPPSATNLLISAGVTIGGVSTTLTSTTATYTQSPNTNPNNASVTVAVVSSSGMATGQYVAVMQSNGLFAGLYQVTGVPDGTHVAIARPQNAPGVATTTTVTTSAKIFRAASDVTATGLNLVGRILVDGLDVIIPSDKLYSEQVISGPDVGVVPSLPAAIPPGTQVLVFLDIWERNVSTAEDPSLVVQPLNTESCVRTKRLWVVRVRSGASLPVLPVQGDPDFAPGHLYYRLASISRSAANSPITAATITDLREHGLLASTIQQPALPANGGKVLILDSAASGSADTHLRIYADTTSIWFTLNASWNGSAWARDTTLKNCGGLRFAGDAIEFLHENSLAATFTIWSRSWNLPMSSTVNSAFELSGTVREIGRVGVETRNTGAGVQSVWCGTSVTFRNRFPAAPSSVTLSPITAANFPVPNVGLFDRDGFIIEVITPLNPGASGFWYGTYTAIA